jgi:peptidoglycan/xylan/chitin deacetylase (PgdA/CDA1 family)
VEGGGGCAGCDGSERLGRRRFFELLAAGVALVAVGPSAAAGRLGRPARRSSPAPALVGEPIGAPADWWAASSDSDASASAAEDGVPAGAADQPALPAAGSGGAPSGVLWSGPRGVRQVALTLDDGTCAPCIAGYVEFAQSSGVHLTFNPNGAYAKLWTPSLVADVRALVAQGQVQIGNHTWDHFNLTKLSDAAIGAEINLNEEWINATFGTSSKPYLRPPFGAFDARVVEVAGAVGFPSIVMWNGTLGDATVESPQEIVSLAERWMQPGSIMLGHLNHPSVLDTFAQLQEIIASRGLAPVTLDEMFGTSRPI